MDKTKRRVLGLTVGFMLFLSTTAERAVAWPCPPPAPPAIPVPPRAGNHMVIVGEVVHRVNRV